MNDQPRSFARVARAVSGGAAAAGCLVACAALWPVGCSAADEAGVTGGRSGAAATGGDGGGGGDQDGATGGSGGDGGGFSGSGGGAGTGASAGAGGTTPPDGGGGTSGGGGTGPGDASDGPVDPLWCFDDKDCAKSSKGPYCDIQSGVCGKCKTTDPNTCPNGMYCHPTKFECVPVCSAGQFNCDCGEVMQCDPGPPPKWVPKSPAVVCNASSGQACDKKTGTCITPPILGSANPTGTYFQYAVFNTSGGVYKSGYDVDSYVDANGKNYMYVNRSGQYLDVYEVVLLDSDNDGKLEPNQHPQNPKNPGPIEARVLTFVKSYAKTGDNAPLGSASQAELYAGKDRIWSLGPSHNGDISEFIFATKQVNVVVSATTKIGMSHMGYGDVDKTWYASNEGARRVYSYCEKKKTWVIEFNYPNLAGSHMDGMEVLVAPATGVQYVYVSDMTSDFLGQYYRDANGDWQQKNIFKYNDVTGSVVEGMGFGALNHFWACGGSTLYEIGGGDLEDFTE